MFKRIFLIVLALCMVLCTPAFASSGFNAGLVVERAEGVISVTVQDSTVLHEKQPTLSIPADASFDDALVLFEGVAVAVTYKDGNVSFKVAKGGTYHIVAELTPVEIKEPTCTEEGANTYLFNDESYVESIENTGHDFSDTSKETCANCEEPNPDYVAPQPPGDEPPGDEPPGDEPPGDEPPAIEPPIIVIPPAITPPVQPKPEAPVEPEITMNQDGSVRVELPAEMTQSGEVVVLPIDAVSVAGTSAEASIITVATNNKENTPVEIPVVEPTAGTVVVIVDAEGNESVIQTCVVTENGVVADLPDGATIKVIDNAKEFKDIREGSWKEDAVDFASSRNLFQGVSEDEFGPGEKMTIGMLATVLARLDGYDTTADEDEHWYEPGVEWAIENGVHDGERATENITREEIAVMLWKYAGSPESDYSMDDFHDFHEASSEEAAAAMRWAVENGVMNGMGNGQLDPTGEATRAQVAQFLKNYIENVK